MHHVREAYDDFCAYRKSLGKQHQSEHDQANYLERIVRKRKSLHQRMKRRLNKDRQR